MLSAAVDVAPARLVVKALETQLPASDFTRLTAAGDAVCCLRHPLTQFVSWKQALATDVWNRLTDGRGGFGKPAKPYRPTAVAVDFDELRAYVAHWRAVNTVLADVPRPIPYPRILNDPSSVCNDLAARLSLTAPPPIGTIRLNSNSLAERIANWHEVTSWFPWTSAIYLNSSRRPRGLSLVGIDGFRYIHPPQRQQSLISRVELVVVLKDQFH